LTSSTSLPSPRGMAIHVTELVNVVAVVSLLTDGPMIASASVIDCPAVAAHACW